MDCCLNKKNSPQEKADCVVNAIKEQKNYDCNKCKCMLAENLFESELCAPIIETMLCIIK